MHTALASTILLIATLLPGASNVLHAQDACSAAGRMVVDVGGAITGADTISCDGTIVRRKYTGTDTANEDCIGTLVLSGDLKQQKQVVATTTPPATDQ